MEILTKPITKENESILALPNDPFFNEGKFIPIYDGANWSYRIEEFEKDNITEDCFPPENYKFEEMGEGFHGIAAYVNGEEAGYALVFEQWNKYLYLDNLLVRAKFRRYGVGTALLKSCMHLAGELGKLGVYIICQNNNLQAMRFYLRNGYKLGGMDARVYDGTAQEGKADLFLYQKVSESSDKTILKEQVSDDSDKKIRLAFFDVDGVLSAPCYLREDGIKNGFGRLEDWVAFCEKKGANAYEECLPLPVVKKHAEELKKNGAQLYALTTSFTDAETMAKEKFVKRCYPDLFAGVLSVREDNGKVPLMIKIAKEKQVSPGQCELVEDTLTTIFAAEDCGIFALHVSRLFA